ncbi:MAG TPA: LamG-like jellyroll fold domain-containing protein, partial [Candidatus Paceibacterota bacterium]|nr:LamG-like jellyroll fold domain-containing protein [Candidatus Paceibacterota bacterium]
HHIVVVATGSNSQTIYYDGVFLDTTSVTISPASTQIGIGATSRTEYWKGNIDDVRIHNRALSASEVKQLYNLGR